MAERITLQQYDNGIKLLLTIRKDGVIEPLTNAKILIKFKNKKDRRPLEDLPPEINLDENPDAPRLFISVLTYLPRKI